MASGKNPDGDPVLFDVTGSKESRFKALVDGYSKDLYRFAFWLCKEPAQAEDLVQETFTRVWKSLDSLRDPAAAKGWLFTILKREHARQFERIRPEIADVEPETVGTRGEYDTSTEAFALRRALENLAPEYREPLVMQVIGGFSCDEIAERMDLGRGAVMTRLFRARKQLRAMLEDSDDDLPWSDTH
ncbi:MAG: sigma-70 family RNA polymerase sigma factor [Gammaproteobacteria bacterium]